MVQETTIEGTVPDLTGRWLAVGWLELAGGRQTTVPMFWEVTNKDGKPFLTQRFVDLPPAVKTIVDKNNADGQLWRPSGDDLNRIASDWNNLPVLDSHVAHVKSIITGQDAFDDTIKNEPRSKDSKWVVRQRWDFDGKAGPLNRQVMVYSVMDENGQRLHRQPRQRDGRLRAVPDSDQLQGDVPPLPPVRASLARLPRRASSTCSRAAAGSSRRADRPSGADRDPSSPGAPALDLSAAPVKFAAPENSETCRSARRGRRASRPEAASSFQRLTVGGAAMKIRPLQDRVLVKRLEEEVEKTKGGIIIPDTAKEKPQQGKVIAVGKGKVNDDGKVTPLDVKVGDTILFGKYSGSEIKLDGEEHLIMREEDILGVVEG